ncbi:MAG: choice-of-anchor tandem repeat GloVer-containing protein, partial [Capsulimonadaceae bacterium]
ETILHGFGDGSVTNDGASIYAPLIQASDGTLYGVTYYGGSVGGGTFFRLDIGVTPAAPPAPTDLTATAGNALVSLSWNPGVGEDPTSYNVYRGTAAGSESATAIATGITTTTYINTGLTNGTAYYYKVAGVDGAGTSGKSNEASATPSSTLPATPTGLTATAGNAKVTLSWTAASGATSYNVYSGTAAGGESATPIATGVTTASYSNTGLTNGTAYYYMVKAVNSAGTSSPSNEASATPWTGVPSAPPGVTAVAGNAQVGLTWGAATGGTSYDVYMGTSSGNESATPVATGVTTTAYTRTGLTNGITYYFIVAAVDSSGTGSPSNEASATPISGAPAPAVMAATSSTGQMILSWSPSATATSYSVFMGTASGGEGSIPVIWSTGTSAIIPGLTNLDAYYFQVAGENGDGLGAPSNEASNEPILETVLHTYGDGTVANDGNYPNNVIQATNGYFYGTTVNGGSAGEGTVFQIDPTGNETILHSFGDGSVQYDGTEPAAGLVLGSDGNLYGTTQFGGSTGTAGQSGTGSGTVFRITTAGAVTILHSFGDGSVRYDGSQPLAGLVQGSDGNFYGTTYVGGSANLGAVFRITPAGVVNILHNFSDGTVVDDGFFPEAALIQASDGNFYGTTYNGQTYLNYGTVFRITPTGVTSILHRFNDGSVANDGLYPTAPLIQASDGNLYGTTRYGGSVDDGTLFRCTMSGSLTILHNFGDGTVAYDGMYPFSGVIQATDGNLYGNAYGGGYAGTGAAYRTNLSGNIDILHGFGDGSVAGDGGDLASPLVQGSDGTLYGTAGYYGSAYYGTFFRIDIPVTAAAPAPPIDLTATAGDAQVSLMWNAGVGENATSYNVYRGTATGGESATPIATGVTTTSYANTGLTNGTAYFYKVAAVDGAGASSKSNEASATPSSALPAVPTMLTATGGNALVALTWTAASGATSYSVYRGTAAGGEGTTPIATGITTASYSNTGLTNGKTYFYTVKAVDGTGTSAASNEASATPWSGAPSAPTGLLATGGNAQVSLTWSSSTGATSYSVYMGTSSGNESATPVATGVTATAYTRTGLTNDSTYYFEVAALDAAGTSSLSNEASATPITGVPVAPPGLAATSSTGSMILSWTAAASATSYAIFAGTASGGESTLPVEWVTGTSAIVPDLTNLDTYYFQVGAVNADGLGALSNEASNKPILESLLHTFGDGTVTNDGDYPNGLVQASNGFFYGTTPGGGSAGEGTVFKIDDLGNETILHSFGDGTVANDGSEPYGGLVIGSDGNLYGTTYYGGTTGAPGQATAGSGTVFRITTAGVETILHNFDDGSVMNDGTDPQGVLIQATDGNFYGITHYGGSANYGTVYQITPSGVENVLHNFLDGTVPDDGYFPIVGLIQGTDGNLYGTTYYGGSTNYGTVYRIAPSGVMDILHSFNDGTVTNDGINPVDPLIEATNGTFYGTTSNGVASNNYGTVFSITSSGAVNILHRFGDGSVAYDGVYPQAGLIQASDGNLYGTTVNGGYVNDGTAFRSDLSGNVTILHGFRDGSVTNDGYYPDEPLIQGADGTLYGVTANDGYYDGTAYYGTYFRIDIAATPSSPSSPADLTATGGDAQVELSWTPGVGDDASSYNVYRGTASGSESATPIASGVTTTSYTNTGLTNGTAYYFKVAAVDSTGTSGKSNEASATPASTLPDVPAGLTATAGNAQVALSWTAATAATSYNVYRGTASGAESTTPISTGNTGTTYTNTGLVNYTTYYYIVRAVSSAGTSSPSNEAWATPWSGVPGAPTELVATPGNTQIVLTWAAGDSATSYNVYMGTSSGNESAVAVATGVTTTSYTRTGLVNGSTYFFKVASVNAAGTSAASNEASAIPIAGPPSPAPVLSATSSSGAILLSWSSVGTATSYDVYMGTVPGGEGALPIGWTTGTTAFIRDLTNLQYYYFEVAAVNADGLSSASNEAFARPILETVLHLYGDGTVANDGANPEGVILGSNGDFYGTTYRGGTEDDGTVFQFTPTGTETILHNFGDGSVTHDGTSPAAGLVLGTDGNFYGTTTTGGSAGDGSVFRVTSAGTVTILHSFGDGTVTNDGQDPSAALIQAADGNFYGTTFSGGSSGDGTVYRITPAGAVTILHNFGDGSVQNDGTYPQAALIQASDGNLYGTTLYGGSNGEGTVFRTSTTGSTTILHSFNDGSVTNDGTYPQAPVIQASDGNFYGTTSDGGSADAGVAFRMTIAGAVTILHSFGDGTVAYDGANPGAGLLQGSDGNLYGVTSSGGYEGYDGTAFRMTLSGIETILHEFVDGSVTNDGSDPIRALIQGPGGTLYGSTYYDPDYGAGTFFQLNADDVPSPPAPPTELTAVAGNAEVFLTWASSIGATSYNVYRGTTSGAESATAIATGVTTTGYTNTGLANGTTFFYKVAALNSVGTSGKSNEAFAEPSSLIPLAPAGLTATPGDNQVALSWTAVTGATSYNVYRGTASGGEGSTPIGTPTGSTYTDTGLTNGTEYFYTVRAVNASGTSVPSNEASATPNPPVPAAPAGLTATAGNALVALSWTASTGATSYNVYRGTATGAEGSTPIGTATTTSYTDIALTNGDKYFYKVSAVNTAGTSGLSNEASATPEPPIAAPPTGLSATAGNTQVALTWTSSLGATSYNLYRGTATGAETATPIATGITGTSYTNTGLTNGVTYYYKAASVNGGGTSGMSNEAFATPEPPAPAAPTGLTATAGNAQVVLSWTGSTGATSYDVYRGTATGAEAATATATGITGSTYTDTGLTNGTEYFYKVAAVNGGGTSAQSNEASATPEPPIPPAPTGLTATAGNTQVALSWTASTGATTYNIYRGTATGGEGSTAIATGVTGSTYTNTGLTNGTTYFYKVAAVNGGGTSAVSSEASATPEPPIPAAPTGLTATAGNAQVALSWTASTGATSYSIYRGTASGGEGASPVGTTTGTTYTDTGLTNLTTYYYKVAAVNGGGTSAQSNEASATPVPTIPLAPTGLTATAGNSQVALSWTASTGATTYNVYRGTATGGESATAIATGITGTSYTNTGLTNGTTYFYKVAAVNGGGTSAQSSEASATPEPPIPAAPTGLAATPGNTQVALSWTASTGATSYNIYRGTATGAESSTPVGTTTGTTYTDTGLTNGVKYFYKVAGVNGGGTSAQSTEASATPEPPAPAAPTGLTATPGNAQVTLAWTASTGATSYSIFRGTATGAEGSTAVGTSTGTTYTDTGLTNGVKYFYKVAAVNGGGTSAESTEASATPEPPAPAAPTGLTATAGNTQVALSWTATTGATSYNIYRATTTGGEGTTAIVTGVTTASYTNTGLTNGTAYFYKIAAVNGGGTSPQSTEASATPEPPVPAAPTGLTATAGNTQVALSWTASTGATSYDVFRSTTSGGEGSVPLGTAVATTYTDVGLTNGVTYFYKVAAVNGGGTSAQSTEASATPEPPVPAAPTGLTATAGSAQVALSWTASTGA